MKIEAITEMKEEPFNPRMPLRSWQVVYRVEKPEDTENVSIQAKPLDGNGVPIFFVDKEGNPVDKNSPEPKVHRKAFGHGFAYSGKTNFWLSGVRPDKVSELLVTGYTFRKAAFKNIALDPK